MSRDTRDRSCARGRAWSDRRPRRRWSRHWYCRSVKGRSDAATSRPPSTRRRLVLAIGAATSARSPHSMCMRTGRGDQRQGSCDSAASRPGVMRNGREITKRSCADSVTRGPSRARHRGAPGSEYHHGERSLGVHRVHERSWRRGARVLCNGTAPRLPEALPGPARGPSCPPSVIAPRTTNHVRDPLMHRPGGELARDPSRMPRTIASLRDD